MERCDSLYECAKTSTSRVAAIAVKLGVERRSPFLGTLAAELTIVSKALDRPTPDQQELFRGRAEKLLVDLEKVCTVSAPARSLSESSITDGACFLLVAHSCSQRHVPDPKRHYHLSDNETLQTSGNRSAPGPPCICFCGSYDKTVIYFES
jgi:hypothetical protein